MEGIIPNGGVNEFQAADESEIMYPDTANE